VINATNWLLFGSNNVNGGINCQNVAHRSKTKDKPPAHWGKYGLMPELFASVNVGKMDFNRGYSDRRDGITQGHAGVGIGGGVQNDGVSIPFRLLNPGYQLSFKVGLSKVDVCSGSVGAFPDPFLDVSEGIPAIHVWFARAQQIQVRPIQKENLHEVRRLGEIRRNSIRLIGGLAGLVGLAD
jgi:hypothetical protein